MKVIIIGGGFCGSKTAKILEKQKNIDLTLIDKKNYFEYYPSLPKTIKNNSNISKIKKYYKDFLKKSNIIIDEVIEVNKKYVITRKQKKHYFDLLVISSGIEYPIFLKNTKNVYTLTKSENIYKINITLKNSKKILIIGGGLIGVETAAEIADKTKDKEIIIVHPHNRLIERNPVHISKKAEQILKKKQIKIIFNEKIVNKEKKFYISNKKNRYDADIAIWCAGIKYNPFFMKKFNEKIFSEKKSLKVNSYLQLKYNKNIFVGGDITDISEEKTGYNAERHGQIIAQNIIKIKNKKDLRKYKSIKTPLVLGLGKYNGIFIYKNFMITGLLPAFLKKFIEKWTLFKLTQNF